jgi:eukaryotic-like serine/threonine-protein kinase
MPMEQSGSVLTMGLAAWKQGCISGDQLAAAIEVWSWDPRRDLVDVLIEQGVLTPERRQALRASAVEVRPSGDAPTVSLGDVSEVATIGGPGLAATTVGNKAGPAGQRYRIIRQHAQGGLGRVSVARDLELGREVALKEIRPERADEQASRRRFVVEARITGALEHPGLAPVYGLGSFADGRPYYTMRFIRGESLSAAIARYHQSPSAAPNDAPPDAGRALLLRRLLGRFMTVCQTMQYAHRRGVIHRDLKPANIMLGNYGETLVVDWGLAKLFSQRTTPNTPDEPAEPALAIDTHDSDLATEDGTAVGTPAYMSPEQAAGRLDQIGPASDIYSLGATLYGILTGQAPFLGDSKQQMLLRARQGDFPPPRQVNKLVPPPLEAICLKAMALEPRDRYASAEALAEDIERYLADEPVSAWREPARVRARRWLRRHKAVASGAVATVAVTLAALATGLAIVGGLNAQLAKANNDLRSARDAETTAHERTRSALNTMTDDVIEGLLGRQAQHQLSDEERAFLRKVQAFYESLAASQGDTAQAQHDRAIGHMRVGAIRARLGEQREAEAAFRAALDLTKNLAAQSPGSAEYREDVARVQSNLGVLLVETGRPREAEAMLRDALAIEGQLVQEFPERRDYRLGQAQNSTSLANLLRDAGQSREAAATYAAAMATLRQLVRDDLDATDYRRNLATGLNNWGMLLAELGQPAEAEQAYRESLAELRKLVEAAPHRAPDRQSLVLGLNNLGILLDDTGRPAEAEAAYREQLATAQRLAADYPAVPVHRLGVAAAHGALASHLKDQGQSPDAEAGFRQAIAVLETLSADFPQTPLYRQMLASNHNHLGILQRETDRFAEAEASYRTALALEEQLVAESPDRPEHRQELARTQHNLGALLYFQKRYPESEQLYRQALELRRKLTAEFPASPGYARDVAKSHDTLGLLLMAMDRPADAEAAYREALALRRQLAEKYPAVVQFRQELAGNHYSLAAFYESRGQTAEAEAGYREAGEQFRKLAADYPAAGDFANNTAAMLSSIAKLKRAAGEHAAARQLLDEARPHNQAALKTNPINSTYRDGLRGNHLDMGRVLAALGDHQAAAQEAELLANLGFDPALDPYYAARLHCLSVLVAEEDSALPEPERHQAAASYADRAMALLSQAVKAGFSDARKLRDDVFMPLRDRAEYQKILEQLLIPETTPAPQP